jgi:hypothetical protein
MKFVQEGMYRAPSSSSIMASLLKDCVKLKLRDRKSLWGDPPMDLTASDLAGKDLAMGTLNSLSYPTTHALRESGETLGSAE